MANRYLIAALLLCLSVGASAAVRTLTIPTFVDPSDTDIDPMTVTIELVDEDGKLVSGLLDPSGVPIADRVVFSVSTSPVVTDIWPQSDIQGVPAYGSGAATDTYYRVTLRQDSSRFESILRTQVADGDALTWVEFLSGAVDVTPAALLMWQTHPTDATVHVPSGGTTGQSLVKASGDDGDTEWATPAGSGDMLAATYDPGGSAADVFDADNLDAGTIPAGRVGAAHIDVITEIAAGLKSGSDGTVITGTAGTDGNCVEWNADGDVVDAGAACGGGGGGVDTSGTPVANDFARFTDADTIEGRSYAEVKADLSLEIGTDVQAYDADLTTYAGITPSADGQALLASADANSFTDADETKLDGIEASADVTDATNVAAAGAHMSGGTDVPVADGGTGASTAADARTNLDVDQAGADNSTDVSLAGTPDYITLSGQVITRGQVDLTADVTGNLPDGNIPDDITLALESATLTAILDNEVLVGTGAGTAAFSAVPDCDDESETLGFTASTNVWVCNADAGAGGGMTSWTLAGDAGTPQTISDGNTATIAGDGVGIDTSAGATDTVTVSYVAADAEAENEGVLDLQDLQGAVTDGQVPDTITITNISQVADITASASEINTPLDGASVTLTEFQELETIGATTISAAQWAGLGGATTAGIALWDDADNVAQLVTLGLTATASEINTPLDGASVALTEFQELETIGATVIEAADWTALAAMSGVNSGDQTITLTGDVTGSGTGSFAATIAGDSVALTTDTTGNYVASVTNGDGISGGDGGSEGAGLTLAVDVIDDGDAQSSTTSSESGFEFVSGELGLLRGCDNGQVQKWDETNGEWDCSDDSTGGSPTFDAIASGTNTSADMVVGDGAAIELEEGGEVEANEVIIYAQNETGGTIPKCTAVHLHEFDVPSTLPEVVIADSDSATLMPATGITYEAIADNDNGRILIGGILDSADTSVSEGWSDGDRVYVDDSGTSTTADCGENMTNVRPANTDDNIQSIAQVLRTHGTQGKIVVSGAGRSNDAPNLEDGHLWVGNATNAATAVELSGDATMTNAGVVTVVGKADSLTISNQTLTTGDLTAAAGYDYRIDIDGMTADRSIVLPACSVDGAQIGWELTTDAPAAYELVLEGDTGIEVCIRGDCATASELTRYFIDSESGKAICNTTASQWRISAQNDGRIASFAVANLSASVTVSTADTLTDLDLDTLRSGVGGILDTTNGYVVPRRNGYYLVGAQWMPQSGITDGVRMDAYIKIDGTNALIAGTRAAGTSSLNIINIANSVVAVDAGEVVKMQFINGTTNSGVSGTASKTWMSVVEQL